MSEQVLAIRKELVENLPNGFISIYKEFMTLVDDVLFPHTLFGYAFIERDYAETCEAWKQIIPYTVLLNDKDEIMLYKRTKKGQENRLHEKYSVGFGGHINPCDNIYENKESPNWFENTVYLAAIRELDEEINCVELNFDKCVGFIYDGENSVGRVHLGFVYEARPVTSVFANENTLELIGYMPAQEILNGFGDKLEGWSKILLEQNYV